MSKKVRNVLAVLMVIFMIVGIILGVITRDEKLYIPFVLLALVLAVIVKYTKEKNSYDDRIVGRKIRMTSGKATIWAGVFYLLGIIMAYLTNFNEKIFIPIFAISLVFSGIGWYLRGKKKDNEEKENVLEEGADMK